MASYCMMVSMRRHPAEGLLGSQQSSDDGLGKMPSNSLADLIISRFRVEKMEGGVVVAGRSFHTASQCPTLILLFSGCFLVAGVALTVLAYRPLTNSNTHYLSHLSGSQIGGPLLVVVGLLFLAIGLALHIVSQRLKLPGDQALRRGRSSSRWFRSCGCWNRASKWIRRQPTKTLSTRKKKVVQDLLASTEFICMIERSNSLDNYESHDVASFPDYTLINTNQHRELKTRL